MFGFFGSMNGIEDRFPNNDVTVVVCWILVVVNPWQHLCTNCSIVKKEIHLDSSDDDNVDNDDVDTTIDELDELDVVGRRRWDSFIFQFSYCSI